MCKERWRTRDLLLNYDLLPYPVAAQVHSIYPWGNYSSLSLNKAILELAASYGFNGNEQDFWNKFNKYNIVTGTLETFPVPGNINDLYFDIEANILYYYKETATPNNDAEVVGISDDDLYCTYSPVKALAVIGN